MRREQFRTISARLDRTLHDNPAYEIPSIAALARQFKVCKTTMWKAVRLLVEKGLIVCDEGSKILRAGSSNQRSADTLLQVLKNNIRNGSYRQGELLPKFGNFVAAHHLSRTTVSRVIRLLSDDQMIHKQGRRWFIGPRPARPAPDIASAPEEMSATALLMGTDIYQNLFRNTYLMPFLEAFKTELAENGLRLRTGYRLKREPGRSPIPNQGIDELRDRIRSWGDFYRGAVMFDPDCGSGEMIEWVRMLSCSGSRPVVYFDGSNDKRSFTRTNLAARDFYYRMHFNEPAAVALALEHLMNAGHRRIALPLIRGDSREWVRQRIALVKNLSRTMDPRPEIISVSQREPFWEYAGNTENPGPLKVFSRKLLQHVRSRMPGHGAVRAAPSREDILRYTPSMRTLVSRGATAILALNDWLATQFYIWCFTAEINVPGDLSLISFDNDPVTNTFPISTVDFGFSRLGYLAARILCGARLPSVDSEGNIPGICTVVDHGSVSAPVASPDAHVARRAGRRA